MGDTGSGDRGMGALGMGGISWTIQSQATQTWET